jgi:hypothetical protein
MSDQPVEGKTADPLEQWRDLRDVYMDAWAKAMGETVNSEAYTQASGALLDTCLTASSPFRDAQKKAMVSALEQLNMPSRADFVSLAERLANLELLLDDMAAKVDEIHQLATRAVSKAEPEAKSQATRAAAQPISPAKSEATTAAQPVSESKPVSEAKSEAKPVARKEAAKSESAAAAQPISAAKPVSEIKSEIKPTARREAAKSAKKGSR